jgi:hypothetical protein
MRNVEKQILKLEDQGHWHVAGPRTAHGRGSTRGGHQPAGKAALNGGRMRSGGSRRSKSSCSRNTSALRGLSFATGYRSSRYGPNGTWMADCHNPYPRKTASSKAWPNGCPIGLIVRIMWERKTGRGERIRTSGLHVPNVALYQAKLHPDLTSVVSVDREGRQF